MWEKNSSAWEKLLDTRSWRPIICKKNEITKGRLSYHHWMFFTTLIWFRSVYKINNSCWFCIHFWIKWEMGKIFDTKIIGWSHFSRPSFFKFSKQKVFNLYILQFLKERKTFSFGNKILSIIYWYLVSIQINALVSILKPKSKGITYGFCVSTRFQKFFLFWNLKSFKAAGI